jgi:hypothetical protein
MKKIICILMCLLMCVTVGAETATKTTDANPTAFINTHKSMANLQPWTTYGVFDIGATGQTGANGNSGAEFDGTYLYSTRWASNLIHRYDKNGTLVEEFSIPGVSGLRDLAFDGTYMYGGAASGTIYKMDFTTKTLIGTITGGFQCRAIAYDSDRDVFYCKSWGNPCWIVDRSGNIVDQFNLGTTVSTYGLAYDTNFLGCPNLWVFDQGDGTDSIIYQWDLTAGAFTGFSYDVNQNIGSGVGIAGGLWVSPDYAPGDLCIGGCVQDSVAPGVTDWLFVYGMYCLTNLPPNTPNTPIGPDEGVIATDYMFSAVTTDPEGEPIYYMFDWGDGSTSDWIGPVDSGTSVNAIHQWASAGTYDIKVKAKDIAGKESDWSPAHTITIVAPSLEMGNITGGLFKIKAVIKNTGPRDAEQVKWSIKLIGGAFIGKDTSGTLTSIPAGNQSTVSSKLILGFGKTTICVSASCTGTSATKDQNGTILLFFIIIK